MNKIACMLMAIMMMYIGSNKMNTASLSDPDGTKMPIQIDTPHKKTTPYYEAVPIDMIISEVDLKYRKDVGMFSPLAVNRTTGKSWSSLTNSSMDEGSIGILGANDIGSFHYKG